MANYEASWDFPQYSAYSILNVINPAICWNTVQNNPLIKGFEVDYLDMLDMQWKRVGETNVSYIQFPSDVYVGESLYRIRIATIGVNGRRSAYSYSTVTQSSPLVFDFTLSQDVRLANGSIVPNQRLLFLVI
jgi:hypothetical protein